MNDENWTAEYFATETGYNDKETYDYVEWGNATKYTSYTMYKLYIKGKETVAPWDYLKMSKAEFIILYYADIRQKYEDNLKKLRSRIITRSNSF